MDGIFIRVTTNDFLMQDFGDKAQPCIYSR